MRCVDINKMIFFFFNDTATTEIYTLSLHDALPISLRPGGKIVISGATSGPKLDDPELTRIFFLQLSVIGSTMGTRHELASLVQLLDATDTRPLIDRTLPLEEAEKGFAAMAGGDVFGKIVFTH